MTQPNGRGHYANLGPPIPEHGFTDSAPLKILHITEISERNGMGEIIFIVQAFSQDRIAQIIKIMVAVNPFNGEPTRAAVLLRPGTGFVAISTDSLPGNLRDICRTIALDPRPEPTP